MHDVPPRPRPRGLLARRAIPDVGQVVAGSSTKSTPARSPILVGRVQPVTPGPRGFTPLALRMSSRTVWKTRSESRVSPAQAPRTGLAEQDRLSRPGTTSSISETCHAPATPARTTNARVASPRSGAAGAGRRGRPSRRRSRPDPAPSRDGTGGETACPDARCRDCDSPTTSVNPDGRTDAVRSRRRRRRRDRRPLRQPLRGALDASRHGMAPSVLEMSRRWRRRCAGDISAAAMAGHPRAARGRGRPSRAPARLSGAGRAAAASCVDADDRAPHVGRRSSPPRTARTGRREAGLHRWSGRPPLTSVDVDPDHVVSRREGVG